MESASLITSQNAHLIQIDLRWTKRVKYKMLLLSALCFRRRASQPAASRQWCIYDCNSRRTAPHSVVKLWDIFNLGARNT